MAAKVYILGAGIAGLSVGHALSKQDIDVCLLEREQIPGGLLRSNQYQGMWYDLGPHFLFKSSAQRLGVDQQCRSIEYFEEVDVDGKVLGFPFGFLRKPAFFFGTAKTVLKNTILGKPKADNAGDYLLRHYGSATAGRVLIPLIEKWIGRHATEISTVIVNRIPEPSLAVAWACFKNEVIGRTSDPEHKGDYWMYPKKGGFVAALSKLRSDLGESIHTKHAVTSLEMDGDRVASVNVGAQRFGTADDVFINTMPINRLAGMIDGDHPMKPYKDLKIRDLLLLFLVVDKKSVLTRLWRWYPDRDLPFFRITEMSRLMPDASNFSLLCVETGVDVDLLTKDVLHNLCLDVESAVLERLNLRQRDVKDRFHQFLRGAYPILENDKKDLWQGLEHRSPINNLVLAGRGGTFRYYSIEKILQGTDQCMQVVLDDHFAGR